jgi:integrase
MIHHLPAGDVTHVSRPGHRRTSCTTVDFQDQVQITAAMNLLQAGVDITVIALWLGHESVATTQIYLQADLALKQQALDRTTPPTTPTGRYRPPDGLLAFLESL